MREGEEFNPYMKFYGLFVPNSVAMSAIPDAAKLLLGRLMQFSGEDGKAYPRRKRLAKELCWKIRKLDEQIRYLKDIKLIKTVRLNTDNHQSPSMYVFLYHKMYDTPAVEIHSTPAVEIHSTPPAKKRSTPLRKSTGHNIRSKIEEKNNRESFSYEKETSGEVLEYNDLICTICGEKQFSTKSGDTCKNVHGGGKGIKEEQTNLLGKLKRIGSQPLKKIESELTIFNYSIEAKQILKCWQDWGGKLHINGQAKGAPNIQTIIDHLLIEGWNPYINLTDDESLRIKRWTVKEICQCIEHYSGTLRKDIDNFYFDQFVIYKHRGKFGRNKKDYSILAETFQNRPKNSEWADSLKKRFTTQFSTTNIYPSVFIKIANFLENKADDYIISDPGNNNYLPLIFFRYMCNIVSFHGSIDQLKYMSGEDNLNIFFAGLLKSFKAKKRTAEEKRKWIIEKPIKQKNRENAIKIKKGL